jgi:serine/threonine protein kinase
VKEIKGDFSAVDLIGRLLGCYQVQARIGVGGMGEVYRALDTKLDLWLPGDAAESTIRVQPSSENRGLSRAA